MLHIIIPTYNRPSKLMWLIQDLYSYKDLPIHLIIIDAGQRSSEVLIKNLFRSQKKVEVSYLYTTADSWWAHCIFLGINQIKKIYELNDTILLLNDDVRLCESYLEKLLKNYRSLNSKNVVIGSAIKVVVDKVCHLHENHITMDKKNHLISHQILKTQETLVKTDLCTGRGVLYDADFFINKLNINYKKLPQHLADLNLSFQARQYGAHLFISNEAFLISENDFGSAKLNKNILIRLFSKKSGERILSHFHYWRFTDQSKNLFAFCIIFIYNIVKRKVKLL